MKRKKIREIKEIIKTAREQFNQVIHSLNENALLLNSKNRIKCAIVSLLGFQ